MTDLPDWPPARRLARPGGYESAWFVTGRDDGRPLVLCHGLAASGLQFVADAAYFASRGHRVIVPDLRGHGRSACPAKRKADDFTIAKLATDLVAILDMEGIGQTDWVGNSLGGITALHIMGAAPERIGRFVSFGTAYRLNVPSYLVPVLGLGYQLLGREVLAWAGAPLTTRAHPGQAIIREMLRTADSDVVLRTAQHLQHYDFRKNAREFPRPMLMIRGRRDVAINQALNPDIGAVSAAADLTVVEMKGAGHCVNLDRPEALRRLILDFLSRR